MIGASDVVLDLAERVSHLADQVQTGAAEDNRLAAAQQRHGRLGAETRGLLALLERVHELNRLGTEWPDTPKLSSFQVSKASRDENWLVSSGGLNFLDGLTAITQSVGAVIAEKWVERLAESASAFPDNETLRLLRERGGDDDTLEAIDNLEHLSDDFAELRRQARPQHGDAEALKNLKTQVHAAWNRVRAGGELSTDRLELLKSVNSLAGKPLSQLSEEDFLWLKNSGSARSLIIRRRV